MTAVQYPPFPQTVFISQHAQKCLFSLTLTEFVCCWISLHCSVIFRLLPLHSPPPSILLLVPQTNVVRHFPQVYFPPPASRFQILRLIVVTTSAALTCLMYLILHQYFPVFHSIIFSYSSTVFFLYSHSLFHMYNLHLSQMATCKRNWQLVNCDYLDRYSFEQRAGNIWLSFSCPPLFQRDFWWVI
jgi:hypothetical protein